MEGYYMKEEREKWTGKIKDKLSEHSEPVSKCSWESILKDASPDKKATLLKGKFRPYIKYVAAACLVIIIGTGITIRYFNKTAITIVDKGKELTISKVEQNASDKAESNISIEENNNISAKKRSTVSNKKQNASSIQTTKAVSNTEKINTEAVNTEAINTKSIALNDKNTETAEADKKEKVERSENLLIKEEKNLLSEKELFGDSIEELDNVNIKKRGKKSNFNNGGLYIAMYTGIGSNQIKSDQSLYNINQNSPDGVTYMGSLNNINMENNLFNPTLLKEKDLKYKIPISYGLSVRKYINSNTSLESGLYFTKLNTQFINDNKSEQNLWYMGIPVKIGYSIYNTKRFDLYISAGGTMEICIAAKYGGNYPIKSVKKIPLQFSINAAAGAQYLFTSHFGLFIEPGVSYFFKRDNAPFTIRSKHPTNFNLNIGFRFNIH